MSFNIGDAVIVNKGTIATIVAYDEGINLFSYRIRLAGGSHETRTEHISSSQIDLIPTLPLGDIETWMSTATMVDAAGK
jgi:hypothetical protein